MAEVEREQRRKDLAEKEREQQEAKAEAPRAFHAPEARTQERNAGQARATQTGAEREARERIEKEREPMFFLIFIPTFGY